MLMQLSHRTFKTLFVITAITLTGGVCLPAQAIPLSDFRAEDTLPIFSEFKKNVNLNPNQQLLWQQTESKVRTILRTRELRRRSLQDMVKASLDKKSNELRDLTTPMNQDEVASLQENQQLRELWLTMYDALDDKQRDIVVSLLTDQLNRIEDHAKENMSRGESPKSGGGRRNKGGASQGGGAGGMGQNVPLGE